MRNENEGSIRKHASRSPSTLVSENYKQDRVLQVYGFYAYLSLGAFLAGIHEKRGMKLEAPGKFEQEFRDRWLLEASTSVISRVISSNPPSHCHTPKGALFQLEFKL